VSCGDMKLQNGDKFHRKLEIIKSNFGDNKMSFGDIITRNGDKKCMEWR